MLTAEQLFAEVTTRFSPADVSTATIVVDAWKALGDIALDRDERVRARECASAIVDLESEFDLPQYGRVPYAKALQFLGEVARRRAVPLGDLVDGCDQRRTGEAKYWFERAQAEYDHQELLLGSLITMYKSFELSALQGDFDLALIGHLGLVDRFHEISNVTWEYRAQMGAIKASAFASVSGTASILEHHATAVANAIVSKALMASDKFWGAVALRARDSQYDNLLSTSLSAASDRVSVQVLSLAAERRWGTWLFAYYTST